MLFCVPQTKDWTCFAWCVVLCATDQGLGYVLHDVLFNPMVCGTQTISPYILRTVTHVPRHSNCFTCDADNVSEIRINHQPHLHKTLQMTTDTPPVTNPWYVAHRPLHRSHHVLWLLCDITPTVPTPWSVAHRPFHRTSRVLWLTYHVTPIFSHAMPIMCQKSE